jgi:hypothetical protein
LRVMREAAAVARQLQAKESPASVTIEQVDAGVAKKPL